MEKKNYEENRFHLARHEIAAIGDELDCDVGMASYEYAHRMGYNVGDGGAEVEEYQEFLEHVRQLQNKTTQEHNLVKAYFYG